MPAVRPPLGPCSPAGRAAGGWWPPGHQLPAGQARSVCVSSSSCGLGILGSRPSQRVSWAGEGAVLGQLDASWNHQVPLTTGCPVPTCKAAVCRCFREAPGPGPDGKWVGQRPTQLASTTSLALADALVHRPAVTRGPAHPLPRQTLSCSSGLLGVGAGGGLARARAPQGQPQWLVERQDTGWGRTGGLTFPPSTPATFLSPPPQERGPVCLGQQVVMLRSRSESLIHLEMLVQTTLLQPVGLALGGAVLRFHGLSLWHLSIHTSVHFISLSSVSSGYMHCHYRLSVCRHLSLHPLI